MYSQAVVICRSPCVVMKATCGRGLAARHRFFDASCCGLSASSPAQPHARAFLGGVSGNAATPSCDLFIRLPGQINMPYGGFFSNPPRGFT